MRFVECRMYADFTVAHVFANVKDRIFKTSFLNREVFFVVTYSFGKSAK